MYRRKKSNRIEKKEILTIQIRNPMMQGKPHATKYEKLRSQGIFLALAAEIAPNRGSIAPITLPHFVILAFKFGFFLEVLPVFCSYPNPRQGASHGGQQTRNQCHPVNGLINIFSFLIARVTLIIRKGGCVIYTTDITN